MKNRGGELAYTRAREVLPIAAALLSIVLSACSGGGGGGGDEVIQHDPPVIGLSRTALRFAVLEGGAAPAPQDLGITNAGEGTLSWTATVTGGSWLSVDSASGTAPSSLGVAVNGSALAAGTYDGTITLSCDGATNSPQTFSVHLTVVADVSFAAATAYPVGMGAHATTTTDLDGDGIPDLVVTNRDSDTVSVLLGTATGALGPKTDFGVGVEPVDVAVGDFDADGTPDLAVANFQGGVTILLGTGDGAFGSPKSLTAGWSPSSIAVGDFDADGDQDLAVANWADGMSPSTVSVFLGTGTGSFGARTSFSAGYAPAAVVAGDLDGDGDQDLAVADYDFNNHVGGRLAILLGNGTGSFVAPTYLDAGYRLISLAASDLDGDGDVDLVVGSESGSELQVLLSSGGGAFAAAVPYALTSSGARSIAIADLDGDGTRDLAVTHNCTCDSTVSVFLGAGAGTFGTATAYAVGGSSVSAADFDRDGRLDLAVADWTRFALLTYGKGDGTFWAAPNVLEATYDPNSLCVADFDGDGNPDIAVTDASSSQVPGEKELAVTFGDGAGGFGLASRYAVGAVPQAVAAADLDGDGELDAVTANLGSVSVLLGEGAGDLGPATNFVIGDGLGSSVAVYDLDLDDDLDVVATKVFSGNVAVLLGDGSGGLGTATEYAVGSEPYSLTIGDLDSDGFADLVVANRGGSSVHVLLGDGSGGFGAAASFSASVLRYVDLADFDHDGKLDLVNADSAAAQTRLGLGDGSFGPPATYDIGGASGAVGDFNGDGRLDVALTEVGGSLVSFLLGAGDGSFVVSPTRYAAALPVDYIAGIESGAIEKADLNGDGKLDLVCSGADDLWPPYVSVLLSR